MIVSKALTGHLRHWATLKQIHHSAKQLMIKSPMAGSAHLSCRHISSCNTTLLAPTVTNGDYLNYTMLYHDSVAFLLSNQLGIPVYMAEGSNASADVAQKFSISVRGASALLVTLCRMNVVQVLHDSDESVDDIVYELTPAASKFLSNRDAPSSFNAFADTLTTNFITPEKLLESCKPETSTEIMQEHLDQDDEEVANNARHFMKHMNAQSYSCAEAFPDALGLRSLNTPKILLDVGGGSAIYTIEAVKSNPGAMTGIVYELPAIKPITEEFIKDAGFENSIAVHPDDTNMKLIEKAYDCLAPGGKIVISELLLADDVKSSTSAATSMNVIMIPYTKGRQYRAKELFCRLEKVGFVEPTVTKLVDDYDLVIGTKA